MNARTAIRVPEDVLRVLSAADLDGPRLMLTGQLDRKLYVDTNKVLEAAGGKWNRTAKAHVFEGDAIEVIEPIILTGEYSRIKQDFGQFDTPPALVERLIELAGIEPGMWVLEPSAGIGNIAVALIERGALVETCEMDEKRCAQLTMRILKLNETQATASCIGRNANFLTVDPGEDPSFDRVVMNPPFARQADIDHVLHALKFLKPGGRLVSVMSAGVMFRADKRATGFRDLVAAKGGVIERLPDGAFKDSGTMVNTCIVTISA